METAKLSASSYPFTSFLSNFLPLGNELATRSRKSREKVNDHLNGEERGNCIPRGRGGEETLLQFDASSSVDGKSN